jgi:hypothetical protein
VKDLASAPDGFDKDASTKLGYTALALAWGIDYREIAPATITGATKADAEVQHQKAKGKWAEVLQRIQRAINQKFLPPHLEFRWDYHDEEDNQLKATAEFTLAQSAEKNLANQALTIRCVREKWLDIGVISDSQFENMELADGRLEDGTDILNLFFSSDPDVKELLKLPLTNPTRINANSPDGAIKAIERQMELVATVNINVARDTIKKRTRQAYAALKTLKTAYEEVAAQQKQEKLALQAQEAQNVTPTGNQSNPSHPKPGATPTGPTGRPTPNRPTNEGRPQKPGGNVEPPV